MPGVSAESRYFTHSPFNVYNAAQEWCLSCHVGWYPPSVYRPGSCWMCGSNENVWQWWWTGPFPAFKRKEPTSDE